MTNEISKPIVENIICFVLPLSLKQKQMERREKQAAGSGCCFLDWLKYMYIYLAHMVLFIALY